MILRMSVKELISLSVLELLETETIDEITVKKIAGNCGITTRAFYNHFRDKNDVVSSIYTNRMRKHMGCPLDEWYRHMTDFFESEHSFFNNTINYTGQNNLGDTILQLEREKFELHMKPDIRNSPEQYFKTQIGIEYMLHGNLGILRDTFAHNDLLIVSSDVGLYYNTLWGLLKSFFPPIVLENLEMNVCSAE